MRYGVFGRGEGLGYAVGGMKQKRPLDSPSPSSISSLGSTSACSAGSNSCPAVVVLNNSTKALTMLSHFCGESFRTLDSRSCWKHDVPIRASVSFSTGGVSVSGYDHFSLEPSCCDRAEMQPMSR